MKSLHRFVAVASATIFFAGSALAQNAGTVANHSVPAGRGAGVAGFGSVGPGTTGQLLSGVTSADPTFLSAGTTNQVLTGTTGSQPTWQPLLTVFNAICTASPSTCVTLLGYANPAWWGAAPAASAATNSSAITSALAASKLIYMGYGAPGTYTINAAISMVSNQRFTCSPGVTITQGNAANLTVFFDFFNNVPANSRLDHCTVDGNLAGNTNASTNLANVNSGASHITIDYNTFTGSSGGDIVVANSTYAIIDHNYCANSINYCVAMLNSAAGSRGYHQVTNNVAIGPMLHLFQVQQVDGNRFADNFAIGQSALGGANSTMQATVSGTTATWVSGTNFSGISANATANVLVCNGGSEYPITAWVSNTQLTISNPGALNFTNQPCAIGSGDIYSIINTSFNQFTGNFSSGGVTGAFVLANQGGAIASTENSFQNDFVGNHIENAGNFCFALEAGTATGSPHVDQTTITGNSCLSPGRSGAAGANPAGVQLFAAAGLMNTVVITGNSFWDPQGVANGAWLTGSGTTAVVNLVLSGNVIKDFANGLNSLNIPIFSNLPSIRGQDAFIIDGLAASCGDSACTTFGTTVTGGGGALKLKVWHNGTNYTLTGK
jgi:hypothetical protein